jgi:hypothetical protein
MYTGRGATSLQRAPLLTSHALAASDAHEQIAMTARVEGFHMSASSKSRQQHNEWYQRA